MTSSVSTPSQSPPIIAPQTPEEPKLHFAYIDGLRGLAACYVMIHHMWLQFWSPDPPLILPPPRLWLMTEWLVYGHFAVDVFIVLSGFCLMMPVIAHKGTLRGGIKGFYLRRAKRILPPYYLACGLSLLLIATIIGRHTGTHWDISVPVTTQAIAAHALLVQDVFSTVVGGKINHALWSIAVECHIYLLFPLLVALYRRAGMTATLMLATVLGFMGWRLVRGTPYLGITPQYLVLFALGMAGAHLALVGDKLSPRLRRPTIWLVVAGALYFGVAALCYRWGPIVSQARTPFFDLVIGVATLALLVGGAHQERTAPLQRLLAGRPLVALGTFAYSIYLIHAPLIQVVWQYVVAPLHLDKSSGFLLLIACGTPFILGCAYCFFLCCERPFLNRRILVTDQPVEAIA